MDVHGEHVARTQLNPVANELLKAGRLKVDAVGAGRQRRDAVKTVVIRDGNELEIRFALNNRNVYPWNHRPGRVGDPASDRRTTNLAAGQGRKED